MTTRKTSGKPNNPKAWGPPAQLSADLQGKIGEKLRELHDDIIREGVPPRFAALLAKLDAPADKSK
jgi:hypothetical protein